MIVRYIHSVYFHKKCTNTKNIQMEMSVLININKYNSFLKKIIYSEEIIKMKVWQNYCKKQRKGKEWNPKEVTYILWLDGWVCVKWAGGFHLLCEACNDIHRTGTHLVYVCVSVCEEKHIPTPLFISYRNKNR